MKRFLLIFAVIILAALSCSAQVSFIGKCTGTTSCTPPTHQTGDLFIVYVGRDATTTAPTLPSGWTNVNTSSINGTSTADSVVRLACKVATTNSETVTGFTNGGALVAHIYRGQAAGTTATCASAILGTPSFFDSTVNTTSTTETFNSVTNGDASSWDAGFGYAPAATAGIGTAPTGMANRSSQGTILGGHDTNGAVASYTTHNVTLTTAGRIITAVVEIKAAQLATPTFTPDAGGFTTVGGVYVTIGIAGGATGCYTTDGSTPTGSAGSCTNGSTYSAPVLISTTGTVLQAIATESTFVNSAVKNSTFSLKTPLSLLTLTGVGLGGMPAIVGGLLQSVACFGTNPYSCTLSATGAGNLITVTERDFATTTAPSAPTDTNSDVFTVQHVSSGHYSFNYLCNSTSGNTTVTILPASGASSAVVSEWSGMATSSCADGISAAEFSNSSSGFFGTHPLESTQTDLAIGATGDASNATNKYTCGSDWSHLTFSPETTDGDTLDTCYYLNGVQSQFTLDGTIGSTPANLSAEAFFKAASAGGASGSYPTLFQDFSGGSGGSAPTATTLNNSTFGGKNANGANIWWSVGTLSGGMTYTSSNEQKLFSNVNVEGVTYGTATATSSLTWNPSVAPANTGLVAVYWSGLNSSASACFYFWYDTTPGVGQDTNFFEFSGGDRATPLLGNNGTNDTIYLETAEVGASSAINVASNTLYEVYVSLTSGGTSSLSVRSCGTPSSPSACGSFTNVTGVTSSTAGTPSSASWGHVSGGSANQNLTVAKPQLDWLNNASATALCP